MSIFLQTIFISYEIELTNEYNIFDIFDKIIFYFYFEISHI